MSQLMAAVAEQQGARLLANMVNDEIPFVHLSTSILAPRSFYPLRTKGSSQLQSSGRKSIQTLIVRPHARVENNFEIRG